MVIKTAGLITVLTFLLFLPSYSQNADNKKVLIAIDELSFQSPAEREAFEKLEAGSSNYLELLSLVESDNPSSLGSVTNTFNSYIQQYQNEIFNQKNEKKKIKQLYDKTHARFLKKYELKNYFHEVFTNGNYNCVSATALYALIFESLKIPYTIKETPVHVYAIAYPHSYRILLEFTDPVKGIHELDDRFKNNFVQQLKSSKMVSEGEAKALSVNSLFDKYYLSDENIDLKKLIGLQYYNAGLYKADEKNFKEAYDLFEKAYVLYPSTAIETALLASGSTFVSQQDYSDVENVNYLIKLTKLTGVREDIGHEHILGELSRINNKLLVNSFQPEKYQKIYDLMREKIKDSTLLKEISFIYNYENARVRFNQSKYRESLSFAKKAYLEKPEHQDAISLLVSAIGSELNTYKKNSSIIDSLESASIEFPGIADNPLFKGFVQNSYLAEALKYYSMERPKDGDKFRALFEENCPNRQTSSFVDESLLTRTYSLAAVYFFRAGNTTKAKSLLKKGLEYSPDNYEFLNRLRMIQ